MSSTARSADVSVPRVSIITVNHNRETYIERTICSVLDQGYDNLEYIVVDTGSDDSSNKLISIYEDELTCLIEPGLSTAAALNLGLSHATGDIVAFIPSGHLLLPGAIDIAVRQMSGRGATNWLVAQCLRIGEWDETLGRFAARAPGSLASFLMHDSGVLPLASSFFSRELLAGNEWFDPAFPYAHDYELSCRLLAIGHVPTVISENTAGWRDCEEDAKPEIAIRRGMEYILAARRYGDRLPLAQRYNLWMNCDLRDRIYTLAEAELQGEKAWKFLFHSLIKHPWWLADESVRRALRHVPQSIPTTTPASSSGHRRHAA
ncbi:MAG: glycosyltransferase [Phycisphaeraceae bacterium]|nr:glycosyltransferase [Phycisphaeraceae bacterium]